MLRLKNKSAFSEVRWLKNLFHYFDQINQRCPIESGLVVEFVKIFRNLFCLFKLTIKIISFYFILLLKQDLSNFLVSSFLHRMKKKIKTVVL